MISMMNGFDGKEDMVYQLSNQEKLDDKGRDLGKATYSAAKMVWFIPIPALSLPILL